MKRLVLLVAVLAVVAVTLMAGPAWGQCIAACVDGDVLSVRVYDDEGEPFTEQRILENGYENVFLVINDGAGNILLAESWPEDINPEDIVDEDGWIVLDMADPDNWVYGGYPGLEALRGADAHVIGAGVEAGTGSPDPSWYNVLSYGLGDVTFGEWVDAGSMSNTAFGCIEDPCEGGGEGEVAEGEIDYPPPVPEGAPVAGMLGLGLAAAACALGGAVVLRKKK